VPERWTRAVLRARLAVAVVWGVVLAGGVLAATQLPSLLTNSFAVPGTGSDRAAKLLAAHFDERPEGTFFVVFRVRHPSDAALRRRLESRLVRAAHAVPTAHADELGAGGGIVYGKVATRLSFQTATTYTDDLRRVLRVRHGPQALVTGQPAIQHDLNPILASDLRHGEALAVPCAVILLLLVLGISLAIAIPFVVAACTIFGTLAGVYITAHLLPTTTFVTNLVGLIGLGLAIDYSLLIVHRFREEVEAGAATDEAVARTMATAGRTVTFSGATVAIALGLLLLVPVPFIRSLGSGALLVALVSIAAALTLQPVLLAALGGRTWFWQLRVTSGRLLWERLARKIIRHRLPVLATGTALVVALSLPLLWLRLVPGSFAGLPAAPESARALELLRNGVGPGAITPTDVVVDAGSRGAARRAAVRRAVARLTDELVHDPEALVVASGRRPPFVDASGQYARVIVVGRHEYGSTEERRLVRRLRDGLIVNAGFTPGVTVEVGGAPAQGADFLSKTYSAFPWLALGIVLVTYLILLRAVRSLGLPLTAVVMNLLTVAAAYGVLVLVFEWGVGADLLGVRQTGHVEGWIPIFLFATLFGLSMDYEMFLVMRMRESWDARRDPRAAVVLGLGRTGRVITAAALIMAAAFAGFVTGRVPGLQQLGVGLAAAVLLDATIVRVLLLPSSMALLGRGSWWLPRPMKKPTT
jgi:RND superfamily putative drug exporter